MKVAEGNVYDNRFDGVQVAYGKDVKLTAGYGHATPGDGKGTKADEVLYAELTGKVAGIALTAGYYDFKDLKGVDGVDDKVWAVAANYGIAKDLTLGAMYLNGDKDGYNGDDDGYVVTLAYKGAKASAPGSWGITAKYYDQGRATYVDHTMDGLDDDYTDGMEGFKGYSIAADYAVAKNIVDKLQWFDLEAKEGDADAETLWAQMVFTF